MSRVLTAVSMWNIYVNSRVACNFIPNLCQLVFAAILCSIIWFVDNLRTNRPYRHLLKQTDLMNSTLKAPSTNYAVLYPHTRWRSDSWRHFTLPCYPANIWTTDARQRCDPRQITLITCFIYYSSNSPKGFLWWAGCHAKIIGNAIRAYRLVGVEAVYSSDILKFWILCWCALHSVVIRKKILWSSLANKLAGVCVYIYKSHTWFTNYEVT